MVGHGRYTVLRKLADGGMAEIFLAKQHGSQGFEKLVVLKRIHTAFVADEQFRNMLIDEAHISMTLSHANIVQVLDLGQAGGRYFMVLELVDGWDLGRLLQRAAAANLPLPAPIALHVVAQVCRALDYAHGKTGTDGRPLGIVHRDVSPQNVLVSEQGEVKLADFGIAKALRKRESTGAGVVKGKIAFMSPEQAQGLDLDARSDIYALGVLLYLLVTGARPYDGATDLEILLRVQKGEFTPPQVVNPNLHPHLVQIIGRAMAFSPGARYVSAHQMLVDLEHVLRSAFGSPGQTELKAWLQRLQQIDGEPPIGRAPAAAPRMTSALSTAGDLQLGTPVTAVEGAAAAGASRTSRPTRNERGAQGGGLPVALTADGAGPTALFEQPSEPRAASPLDTIGAEDTSIQDLRVSGSLLAEGPPAIRPTQGRGGGLALLGLLALVGLGGAAWFFLSAKPATSETSDAPEPTGGTLPDSKPRIHPLPPPTAPDEGAAAPDEGVERGTVPEGAGRARPSPPPTAPAPRAWRRGDELPDLLEGSPAAQPAGDKADPPAPAAAPPVTAPPAAAPPPAVDEGAAPGEPRDQPGKPAQEPRPDAPASPARKPEGPAASDAVEDPFAQ